MNNLVEIGTVGKPHGVKGTIRLHLEEAYLEDFLNAAVIFINTKGQQLPYFITDKKSGNTTIAKLEDIDSKEDAMLLTNAPVFLKEEDVTVEVTELDLVFAHLENYQLQDQTLGMIGLITSIEEYPNQEMAVVHYKGRDVLIPLHESLIQQIDDTRKVLIMDLPEGILELY